MGDKNKASHLMVWWLQPIAWRKFPGCGRTRGKPGGAQPTPWGGDGTGSPRSPVSEFRGWNAKRERATEKSQDLPTIPWSVSWVMISTHKRTLPKAKKMTSVTACPVWSGRTPRLFRMTYSDTCPGWEKVNSKCYLCVSHHFKFLCFYI